MVQIPAGRSDEPNHIHKVMSSPSRKDLLLADLRNSLKSREKELLAKNKEVELERTAREACENELLTKEEILRTLENRRNDLETDYNELKHTCKTLKNEKRELESALAKTSEEADRLHAQLQSKGGTGDVERSEVVRLHDRISQYRKEVETLKKENGTLNTVIKAKDRAIEESEAAVAEAIEANASKRKDLNIILDLQRQLKETEDRLGGEANQNKLTDSENAHYRSLVKQKEDEIDTLLDQIECQKGEVLEARKVRAAADVMMAEAKAKMAESVEMSERARRAEAERVGSGGFVPMNVHETTVSDLEACQAVIREYAKGDRDGTVLALRAAKASADARTSQMAAQALKAKMHLAKALGEYDYTLLLNEPPPTEAQVAAAEALVVGAMSEEAMTSFEAVVSEKEREVEMAKKAEARAQEDITSKDVELQMLRDQVTGLQKASSKMEAEVKALQEKNKMIKKQVTTEMRSVGTSTEETPTILASPQPFHGRDNGQHGGDGDRNGNYDATDPTGSPRRAGNAAPQVSPVIQNPTLNNWSNTPQVSREALASIVSSLVASKQSKIMALYDDPEAEGASHSNNHDDEEELYRNAIAMLQEELAKLTDQMTAETDVAARIRQQVGDWKTAQLSAKQTAELLDSYNQMSMKVAAQTAVMTQRQEAYERAQQTERALTNEIADLRTEIRRIKGKSPLRSVKKALSSTVKGVKQTFSSPAPKAVTTAAPMGDAWAGGSK